jgi:hypothetical protein
MNIRLIRFLNLVFVAIMLSKGIWNFLWYIGAMHLSLEILNRQQLYLQHRYQLYNSIFWSYSLVLLERLRTTHFNETAERLFNCAEHLFFGIIICLKVYIYTALFTKQHHSVRLKRGLLAFILFNLSGLLNEVIQNQWGRRNLFVFTADSAKDMWMNLMGAGVFILAVMWRVWRLSCNSKQFNRM